MLPTMEQLAGIRRQLNLTQHDLAKRLGISRQHLSKVENSHGSLSPRLASRVAEVCRTSGLPQVGPDSGVRIIPVRSWAQAGSGANFEELPLDWQKQIATDCPDERAFAVEIQGDSMEPKFSPGDYAVLMPTCVPRNGCLVVARLEAEGVVFKVFTARDQPSGKVCSFTSYNPVFQPIEVSDRSVLWNYPVYQMVRQVWR
jgi:SOS-response transcriptional repressor LexA